MAEKFDWDDPIVDQTIIMTIAGCGLVFLTGAIIATVGVGSVVKKLIRWF